MDSVEGMEIDSSTPKKNHLTASKDDKTEPNHSQMRFKDQERREDSFLARLLMHYCNAAVRCARHLMMDAPRILAQFHIQDFIRETKVLLSNHPFAASVLAIMTVACGIPIVVFVAFAVITILFTFGGFLVIEGAVLAAGSFALLLCLTSMVVVFIFLSFLGGLLYITYMQVESMVRLNVAGGDQVQLFDSRLPQVLASLRNLPHTNRHSHARATHSSQSPNHSNGHMHSHDSK